MWWYTKTGLHHMACANCGNCHSAQLAITNRYVLPFCANAVLDANKVVTSTASLCFHHAVRFSCRVEWTASARRLSLLSVSEMLFVGINSPSFTLIHTTRHAFALIHTHSHYKASIRTHSHSFTLQGMLLHVSQVVMAHPGEPAVGHRHLSFDFHNIT